MELLSLFVFLLSKLGSNPEVLDEVLSDRALDMIMATMQNVPGHAKKIVYGLVIELTKKRENFSPSLSVRVLRKLSARSMDSQHSTVFMLRFLILHSSELTAADLTEEFN